ncbi:MAG: HEAT repeat-containing protein [Glomeribacter sp. 1016415]|nr:HEAT repeat-containing protein [Glomeribacter sp. 1016415]
MNISGWGQSVRATLPAPVITPQNHVTAAQAHIATGDRVNAEKSYKAAIQLATAELAKDPGHPREMALARISAEYAAFLARENESESSSRQQSSIPTGNSASASHRPNFSSYSLPFPIQAGTEGKIVVQNCQGTINAPVHGKNNTVTVYYSPNSEVRPSHAVSLDSLRNALYQHYQLSNLSIQRVSGETASLEDCYINLAIVESLTQRKKDKKALEKQAVTFERLPSSERLEGTNSSKLIALEKLFEPQKLRDGSEGVPKRILIQGRAGIGKTTLCKKLVYEYYENKLWQDRFESVLWVPLRQLKRHYPTRLEDLLCNQYFSGHESRQAQALSKALHAHQDETLFILDGLDEVVGELGEGSFLRKFVRDLLTQAHVVITSRPAGVDISLFGQLDLELETVGFSRENVQAYIQTFVPETNRLAVQQLIDRAPLIQELVNIPIQLDVLCYSWDSLPLPMRQNATITMTALYQAMVERLWHKDGERLGKKAQDGTLLQLSDIQDLSLEQIEKQLIAEENEYLSYLAFKGLQETRIEFDLAYFNVITNSLNETRSRTEALPLLLKRDLKQTSFLHTADSHLSEGLRAYHFLHLTFQEFFAAKFLAKHFEAYLTVQGEYTAQAVNLENRLVLDAKELQDFIMQHKYNPRYQIVWWMVAGLLKNKTLEGFFTLLEKRPLDLIGGAHLYLIMHCLHEARSRLALLTVERLEKILDEGLLLDIRLKKSYENSRLARQPTFPEHLLLTFSEKYKQHQFEIFEAFKWRPTVSGQVVKILIEALQNENADTRASAVKALGPHAVEFGSIRDILIQRLTQELHASAKMAIAEVLGQHAAQFESIRDILIQRLTQEPEAAVREVLAKVLGQYAAQFKSIRDILILQLMQEQEAKVITAITNALGSHVAQFESIRDILIQRLIQDSETPIRIEIVEAPVQRAARFESKFDQDLFIEIQRAKQMTVNEIQRIKQSLKLLDRVWQSSAIVRALGPYVAQSESIQEILIRQLTQEPYSEVREAIAGELGQYVAQSECIREIFIQQLTQERNTAVRATIAKVLGRYAVQFETIQEILIRRLTQESEALVREAVVQALGWNAIQFKFIQEILIQHLMQEPEATVRTAIIHALDPHAARIQSIEDALLHKQEPKTTVKAVIVDSIQKILVQQLTQESEATVRAAIVQALGPHAAQSESVREILIRWLTQESEDVVRVALAKALGQHTAQFESVQKILIRWLMQEPETAIRAALAEALGQYAILFPESLDMLTLLIGTPYADDVYTILGYCPHYSYRIVSNLCADQLQEFYTKFMLPNHYKTPMPFYYQNKAIHFYTSSGPGESISISDAQFENITRAFTQARKNF